MSIKEIISKIPIEQVIGHDIELTESGQRYFRGVEHDSLVIDKQTNLFYWNSAGMWGNALDWLTKIRGYSVADALEVLQQYSAIPIRKVVFDGLFKPNGPYYKLLDVFYNLGKKHRDYWYGRGYTDATIDAFKLGYTGIYYTIPIMFQSKLLNFQCRTPEKKIRTWTRGLGIQPFNFDILPNTDWVVITEGPVDAIIATQYRIPAISLLPNALNWDRNLSEYLAHIQEIYLFFDNDEAGLQGMRKVGKTFHNKCKVVDWEGYPEKFDVGDLLKLEKGKDIMGHLMAVSLPYDALKDSVSWSFYKGLVNNEGNML